MVNERKEQELRGICNLYLTLVSFSEGAISTDSQRWILHSTVTDYKQQPGRRLGPDLIGINFVDLNG